MRIVFQRLLLVVALVVACAVRAAAGNSNVTITVNAAANQRAIDPRIYGVAFAGSTDLLDLNCPLNRHGGNGTSRYNWQTNASNHAADWYFESIDDGSSTPGASADSFISGSRAGGAEPLLTIPMIGWVAKLGASRGKAWSYSIAKYGAQTGNDSQWCPDAGNGVLQSTGQNFTNNDPNDASVLTDSTFQQNWVRHLTNRWGTAANGGLKYYILDNEHSIWHGTHRDVHPVGATMEEIRNKMIEFAGKIKAVEPNAVVVGPEEWGWSGYILSGYDQWYGPSHGWSSPDRNAHGGMDYMPWLLDQLRQTNNMTGQRLLDVFSLHIYPQGGEFGDDVSTAMQLRRNRSTRALWDTNYIDETWINTQVKLIPRMRSWVNTYYPGTQIAITEYNWGAESYINGATAQADILGIFGREGLDIGTRWTTPASNTPTYKAIKIYRNYDGAKSTFGDTSVLATASISADCVSSFAATRSSDGAMTVIVINKLLSDTATITITFTNFNPAATGQVWQLTSANAIQHLSNVSLNGRTLSTNVSAQSITLFVIPPSPAGPGDGIPDNWKIHYFNSTNSSIATNDPDHDGMNNLAEYIAGTDPTNANSCFGLTIGDAAGSDQVRFPASRADSNYCAGLVRYYLMEYSTNLLFPNCWTGIQNYTSIPAFDQTVVYTNSAPDAQRFYRGKVWLK